MTCVIIATLISCTLGQTPKASPAEAVRILTRSVVPFAPRAWTPQRDQFVLVRRTKSYDGPDPLTEPTRPLSEPFVSWQYAPRSGRPIPHVITESAIPLVFRGAKYARLP